MNKKSIIYFIEKLPFQERKQKNKLEEQKELEKRIRNQGIKIAEELNFRLLCFQLEEMAEAEDGMLLKILQKANMYPLWNYLTKPQEILWIDSIVVEEITYPVKRKPFAHLKDRFICFLRRKIGIKQPKK